MNAIVHLSIRRGTRSIQSNSSVYRTAVHLSSVGRVGCVLSVIMRSPLNSVTLSIVGESVGQFVREKARGCLDDTTVDSMMKSVYAREMERCVSDWSFRRPEEEVSIVVE